MEEHATLLAVTALAVIALFTRRLERSPVTVPMLCALLGAGLFLTDGVPAKLLAEDLTILAEVALAVVLFQ